MKFVVAGPRDDGLPEPVAYVVPEPGDVTDQATLMAHAHARLAGFKRPAG